MPSTKLNVETQSAYYGKATFGNSDWLDATMSLVNYGDRGVPRARWARRRARRSWSRTGSTGKT